MEKHKPGNNNNNIIREYIVRTRLSYYYYYIIIIITRVAFPDGGAKLYKFCWAILNCL